VRSLLVVVDEPFFGGGVHFRRTCKEVNVLRNVWSIPDDGMKTSHPGRQKAKTNRRNGNLTWTGDKSSSQMVSYPKHAIGKSIALSYMSLLPAICREYRTTHARKASVEINRHASVAAAADCNLAVSG